MEVKAPKTMADLRAYCKENGWHWFDRATMDFFGSKIETRLKGGTWFIESQRSGPAYDAPRTYILRYLMKGREHENRFPIAKYATFETLQNALDAFKELPPGGRMNKAVDAAVARYGTKENDEAMLRR